MRFIFMEEKKSPMGRILNLLCFFLIKIFSRVRINFIVNLLTKVVNGLVSFQCSGEQDIRCPDGEGVVLFPDITARLASLPILYHQADHHRDVGREMLVHRARLIYAVDFWSAIITLILRRKFVHKCVGVYLCMFVTSSHCYYFRNLA